MNVWQQTLILFLALQILFAYYEYRLRADPIYVFTRLLQPKYLLPSVLISLAYLILTPLIGGFFRWFFKL